MKNKLDIFNKNTTTIKNTPKTTTKNNITTTINTARTTTTNPVLSTIFTTTTTDLAVPTHYNNNSTETIDITGQIIKEVQQEITSSPVFIPVVGLLFALIPVFVFCLCYAKC
jgi:hypothetical protein